MIRCVLLTLPRGVLEASSKSIKLASGAASPSAPCRSVLSIFSRGQLRGKEKAYAIGYSTRSGAARGLVIDTPESCYGVVDRP